VNESLSRNIFKAHLEIINPVWFTKPLSPSELCIHNNDLQIYQTYLENKVEVEKFLTLFMGHCLFDRNKKNFGVFLACYL